MEIEPKNIEIKEKLKNIDSALTSKNEDIGIKVQKQLEFYLGDNNLTKDKFLRKLIEENKNQYVSIETFLNFNKIKLLLQSINSRNEQFQIIRKSIEKSTLLKMNKLKTKVKRKVNFVFDDNFLKQNDKKTIYIENFPENTTHEKLAEIFSSIGKIVHVSIPKYSETKISKGFAFIEFSIAKLKNLINLSVQIITEKEAQEAIEKYNNCIPKEFLENEKGKLSSLKVISKTEWLVYKEEFKKIKKELKNYLENDNSNKDDANEKKITNAEFIEKKFEFQKGCLLRLN